ncbi:MAG: trigger factor [Kiritimatiellae bacterium]|nr:trigger factor [Kiritimatiellia bacterium]
MKAEVENVGPCKVKVVIKAEADETRPEYEKVMKMFMAHGRVAGFRPGKVPRAIIQKTFSADIKKEVEARLFHLFYRKMIEEKKIREVALTNVENLIFSPETGVMFTVTMDVEPEFDLPKYKKISVPLEVKKVTDDDVEQRLNAQRRAFAKFNDATDANYEVAADDLVEVDFEGFVDGKPIAEVEPGAKSLGAAKNFWLQIDPDRFIPEIVDGLKGMKVGESKEIKFKFEKGIQFESLSGKKAVFNVTVNKIRQCELPTDEVLLKQLKADDMASLREKTRKAMESAAEMDAKRQREEKVREELLKKADFDLPDTAVDSEISRVLDQMMSTAQYRGITKEQLAQDRAQILEIATNTAKRNLHLRYVLEGIAKEEKIEVTDAEYNEKMRELAGQFQVTPAQLKEQIEKAGNTRLLRSQVLSEKTMQFIIDQMKA